MFESVFNDRLYIKKAFFINYLLYVLLNQDKGLFWFFRLYLRTRKYSRNSKIQKGNMFKLRFLWFIGSTYIYLISSITFRFFYFCFFTLVCKHSKNVFWTKIFLSFLFFPKTKDKYFLLSENGITKLSYYNQFSIALTLYI